MVFVSGNYRDYFPLSENRCISLDIVCYSVCLYRVCIYYRLELLLSRIISYLMILYSDQLYQLVKN